MSEQKTLVIATKVREFVKEQSTEKEGEYRLSSEFTEVLSEKVEDLIKMAVSRAAGNGRKTLKGLDL
jgi:histone H3/H4